MKCAAHAHAGFTLSGGLATTTLVRLAPSMAMEAVLLGAWCTAVQPAQKMSQTSQSACARSWPARPALRLIAIPWLLACGTSYTDRRASSTALPLKPCSRAQVAGRIFAVNHGLRLPMFPAAASSKSLLHVTEAASDVGEGEGESGGKGESGGEGGSGRYGGSDGGCDGVGGSGDGSDGVSGSWAVDLPMHVERFPTLMDISKNSAIHWDPTPASTLCGVDGDGNNSDSYGDDGAAVVAHRRRHGATWNPSRKKRGSKTLLLWA